MATKKQRRRREKERRHEYEVVYVDDAGNEVKADEEPEQPKPRKAQGAKPKPAPDPRTGKPVEPPSWNRVMRRAAIFAPIMLVVLYLVRPKDQSTVAVAVQAALLVGLLIPFMYLMDAFLYRSYQKRIEKRGSSRPKTK